MTLVVKICLLLLFVIVSGCAGALERSETTARGETRAAADKERQEKEKETLPPTFTYRP